MANIVWHALREIKIELGPWVAIRRARLDGRFILVPAHLPVSHPGLQASVSASTRPGALRLGSRSMPGRSRASLPNQTRARRLAHHVRMLREARGWNRRQLAEAAEVSERTLARLEAATVSQPGVFTVAALAEALAVNLDSLLLASEPRAVWSVGYEGRTVEAFIDSLSASQVEAVADVRLNPISRKPGFSKTRLRDALAEAGIAYLHLRSLGNPKENRAPFWEGRIAEGLAGFHSVLESEPAQRELAELTELAREASVAVLCFEHDERRCHRQAVLNVLRERTALPVAPLA